MLIEFDPLKNLVNLAKHGLSLTKAIDLDWDRGWLEPDRRRECRRYEQHEKTNANPDAD